LADAQAFIDMKELNAGQESQLFVVRTIHVVNYRMREMTPAESFDHLQQNVDFSQIETAANNSEVRASAAKSESNLGGEEDQVNRSQCASGEVELEDRKNLDENSSNALTEPGSIIYLKKREQKGQ
jgi:hypothetical protein